MDETTYWMSWGVVGGVWAANIAVLVVGMPVQLYAMSPIGGMIAFCAWMFAEQARDSSWN